MKELRTFKAGSPVSDLVTFLEGSLCELLGDSAPTISTKVRITVELVKADDLVIDGVLQDLALEDVKDHVLKFIEYRRDELRKPITLKGLRRELNKFATRPACAKASIIESMEHSWTGLFEPKGNGSGASRDYQTKKGGPSGGTW